MELFVYLAILTAAMILALLPRTANTGVYGNLILIMAAVALSVTVRVISPFDEDILVYAQQMRAGGGTSLYYWKEPVVWLGQAGLYSVLGNEALVFIVFDLTLMAVLFSALRSAKLPLYACLALLCFFPAIMGFQNVYRQWASLCFIVSALAVLPKHRQLAIGLFVLAVGSHNSAALFAGCLFAAYPFRYRQLFTAASFVLAPIAIVAGSTSKSSWSTGLSLEYLYAAVMIVVALALVAARWPLATNSYNERMKLAIPIYVAFLAVMAPLLLESATAERISISGLFVLFPMIVDTIDSRIKEKTAARMLLTVGGFVPALLFGVRVFILPS